MSKGAYILSFRALQELGGSLERFSSKVLESLEVIQSEIKGRVEVLENRQSDCTDRLRYLQQAYEDADDEDGDEDRESISREIERAEEDLREIRYWMRQVEESLGPYMRHARAIHEIATTRTAKANSFLQQKLAELHSYINTQADGSSSGSENLSSFAAGSAHALGAAAENVHMNNYQEFREQFQAKNIQFIDSRNESVNEADIMSPEHTDTEWDQRQSNFWNHHGYSHDTYQEMAEKYRTIQQGLSQGRSLDELRLDGNLRPAIEFWWSKSDPVKLYKHNDTYWVDSGFHRVTLAKNHHLGSIPAMVTEAALKEKL